MNSLPIKIKDIPDIQREGSLMSRLLPVILIGFDDILDKESKLYLYLLVRLIDKSFIEYEEVKNLIKEELKTENRLENRFNIISCLENCLYSINRAIKILDIIVSGHKKNSKITKKDFNILKFISEETIINIKEDKVSKVRNRVEHITEDIFYNKFSNNLFLDVDINYEKICINNESILLIELVKIIGDYHNFVLEIFKNFPNRKENGKYFYDK
jgi:hypothetical protein